MRVLDSHIEWSQQLSLEHLVSARISVWRRRRFAIKSFLKGISTVVLSLLLLKWSKQVNRIRGENIFYCVAYDRTTYLTTRNKAPYYLNREYWRERIIIEVYDVALLCFSSTCCCFVYCFAPFTSCLCIFVHFHAFLTHMRRYMR